MHPKSDQWEFLPDRVCVLGVRSSLNITLLSEQDYEGSSLNSPACEESSKSFGYLLCSLQLVCHIISVHSMQN